MARQRRRLKNLRISEVSFVDRPANLKPFLFFKRQESTSMNEGEARALEGVEKRELDLDVNFTTKGNQDNTAVKVNGKAVKNLTNFSLYFAPIGNDDVQVGCTYTVRNKGETVDGFASTRTYSMYKNREVPATKADADDVTALQALVPEINADVDPELAKALAAHASTVKLYSDDLPLELAEAIKSIISLAASTEVEEVGGEVKAMTEGNGKDTGQTNAPSPDVVPVAATVAPAVPAENVAIAQPTGMVLSPEATKAIVDAIAPKVAELVADGIKNATKSPEGGVGNRPASEGQSGGNVADPAAGTTEEEEEISPEQLGADLAAATAESLANE